jgi:hypothetical protein
MRVFSAQRGREIAKLLQLLDLMIAAYDWGRNTRQQSANGRHHKTDAVIMSFQEEARLE